MVTVANCLCVRHHLSDAWCRSNNRAKIRLSVKCWLLHHNTRLLSPLRNPILCQRQKSHGSSETRMQTKLSSEGRSRSKLIRCPFLLVRLASHMAASSTTAPTCECKQERCGQGEGRLSRFPDTQQQLKVATVMF